MTTHRTEGTRGICGRVPVPLLGNTAGIVTAVAWLAWSATVLAAGLDGTFKPGIVLGTNESVRAVIPDGAGRWLVGHGSRVSRLLADGRKDDTFDAGAVGDGEVTTLAQGSEGKLYVGGRFLQFGGRSSPALARLMPDGRVDATYPAGLPLEFPGRTGVVESVAFQADGKLLVGGQFQSWNGQRAPSVLRLAADGSVDVSFTENVRRCYPAQTNTTTRWVEVDGVMTQVTEVTVNYDVLSVRGAIGSVTVREDGRILIAGVVSALVNPDGLPAAIHGDATPWVRRALPGGEVLLAAVESRPGSATRTLRVRRVRPDDAWSVVWEVTSPFPIDGELRTVALDEAGGIWIGGTFRSVGGHRCEGVARLNADGSVDPSMATVLERPETSPWEVLDILGSWVEPRVEGLEALAGGGMLAFGRFSGVNGLPLPGLARWSGGQAPDGPPAVGAGRGFLAVEEGTRCQLGFPVTSRSPVSAGWEKDGVVLPGATTPVLELGVARLGSGGVYRVRLTNAFGVTLGPEVRLAVALTRTHPGSLDGTFPQARVVGAGSRPSTVATSDSIWVVGEFEGLEDHATRCVARLNRAGVVDRGFVMLRGDARRTRMERVEQWVPLSDGRYAAFLDLEFGTRLPGEFVDPVVVVKADGAVDPDFRLGVGPVRAGSIFSGISQVAAGPGGTLFVSGRLVTTEGGVRGALFRLLPNGTPDPTFRPPGWDIGPKIAVQSDGAIVVARPVSAVGDPIRVERLLSDGQVDPAFRPWDSPLTSSGSLRTDRRGRIWLEGNRLTDINMRVFRLLPDGTPDAGFVPFRGANWSPLIQVFLVGTDSQDRALVMPSHPAGGLTIPLPEGMTYLPSLVRLEDDGALDASFALGTEYAWFPSHGTAVTAEDQLTGIESTWGGFRLFQINGRDERRIETVRDAAGQPALRIQTRPGRRYRLESAANPVAGRWAEIGAVDGDGTAKTVTVGMGDGSPRYFRMRLEDR